MKHSQQHLARPSPGVGKQQGAAPAALAALLLFGVCAAGGCGRKTADDRTAEERRFLAPTNIDNLRPEARAHLPTARNTPPKGSAAAAAAAARTTTAAPPR